MSGATVSALQGYTVAASATTNTSGNYTLGSLAAGTYVVTVTATGFKTQSNTGVTVTEGSTATANFWQRYRSGCPYDRVKVPLDLLAFINALAWIIHEVSSKKRKDALKGMMNTGFAHPAFPFGASIA